MSKRLAGKIAALDQSPHVARGSKNDPYDAFDSIDGRHPWQSAVPDGYVAYPVRRLERGKIVYFNFSLAREMGLLASDHPDQMNIDLERKLLDTFCIQIINEYDQENGARIPEDAIKPYPYMATRYLQLQHSDKQGRTSGDGRSVWNGTVHHKGKTWDISSRGTGVTCLAPGAVEADRPLKTGASEFGYGCGMADMTELYGSALMSEIFHRNGIETERCLAIIDLGKGCGIGVRAAPNLTRPAHLFLYLKQGRLDSLKKAADYLIRRQTDNRVWRFAPNSPQRYQHMLTEISRDFARFAARLERNYIFAWLDWDGDNVLANAGIIDYGSIRQFGLRHDQYRYDDVQRFSTNLNEQRGKARLTVQVFAQLVDYLETGDRKPVKTFFRHPELRRFDREFDREIRHIFLQQIGFDQEQVETALQKNAPLVEKLYAAFSVLERMKTKSGFKKLPDGVNRPAIFNMRTALRELPRLLLETGSDWPTQDAWIDNRELLDLIASSHAKRADLSLKGALNRHLSSFRAHYLRLMKTMEGERKEAFLKALAARAWQRNRAGRITGNGAEFIVDAITRAKRRGVSPVDIQTAMEMFIASQSPPGTCPRPNGSLTSLKSPIGRLYQEFISIATEHEDDI